MEWISIAVDVAGLASALGLYYASTDPPGRLNFFNDDPRFAAGLRRRKLAAKGGLILVAVGFLLQLVPVAAALLRRL